MCCIAGKLVVVIGALSLFWIGLQLLPYVLVGLGIWVTIDIIRFHRRRKRAEASQAFQPSKHQPWQ